MSKTKNLKSKPRNLEIEARFLEINPKEVKRKLKKLGAKDFGEKLVSEIILFFTFNFKLSTIFFPTESGILGIQVIKLCYKEGAINIRLRGGCLRGRYGRRVQNQCRHI